MTLARCQAVRLDVPFDRYTVYSAAERATAHGAATERRIAADITGCAHAVAIARICGRTCCAALYARITERQAHRRLANIRFHHGRRTAAVGR